MDKITIRKYKWQDAISLLKDPNEKGLKGQKDAMRWAKLNEREGVGYTAVCKGEIIGCGGVRIYWDGGGEAWALLPRKVGEMRLDHKIAKRQLYKIIDEQNLTRVQSTPRCDWPEGLVYAKYMGFKVEGKMRKYLPDGNGGFVDVFMMSIIKD